MLGVEPAAVKDGSTQRCAADKRGDYILCRVGLQAASKAPHPDSTAKQTADTRAPCQPKAALESWGLQHARASDHAAPSARLRAPRAAATLLLAPGPAGDTTCMRILCIKRSSWRFVIFFNSSGSCCVDMEHTCRAIEVGSQVEQIRHQVGKAGRSAPPASRTRFRRTSDCACLRLRYCSCG